MTNKYQTGKYLIYYYDQHGTKQDTDTAAHYVQAMQKGSAKIKNPPYASFTVVRVIHNSLDDFNPWANR